MEVEHPTSEIAPPPHPSSSSSTGGPNSKGDAGSGSYGGLPFSGELLEVHRGSGQRFKLQVEAGDYKFLSITDSSINLADLRAQLEAEYTELYPTEPPIIIQRLQDSRRNDMPLRFKVSDLLKDKDKIYVVIKPVINPDEENAEAIPHQPKQRGRKRKNPDLNKDSHNKQETPKKPALSPQQQMSLSASQTTPSQPSTPTQTPHHYHGQSLQLQSPLGFSSPGVKALTSPSNPDRIMCTPYCAIIDIREQVPCTHCGELRPYVVPDGEKTDKNQCSKWCVTGSTRKLKAAGLEFCSICLARHRAGKYDLRKAHQCVLCHRPWLHLDEYSYCRTCRKSAMGTERTPIAQPNFNHTLIPMHEKDQLNAPPPMLLMNGGGPTLAPLPSSPHHLSSHHMPSHHLIPPHQRMQSPPQHITLHDLHKSDDKLSKSGGTPPHKQSIQLQGLQHFQQQLQSQQLLATQPPQSHQKDDEAMHDHEHIAHEHDAHTHPHAHAHAHAHAHSEAPSAEQIEMVLTQMPPPTGHEAETNSYYDPTMPTQEKVVS